MLLWARCQYLRPRADKAKLKTFTLRDGTRITIRNLTDDLGILWEVFVAEVYAKEASTTIAQISESDIVVDIGGHIGIFSIYAAGKARCGRVLAFEPFDVNYGMFEKNLAQNPGLGNIDLFKQAVSSSAGRKTLYLSTDKETGDSSFYKVTENAVEVDCVSIKDIFETHGIDRIDFLKMDCEGAEYEILFNLGAEYLEKIKTISLEYHRVDGYGWNDLVHHLRSSGFSVSIMGSEDLGNMIATRILPS